MAFAAMREGLHQIGAAVPRGIPSRHRLKLPLVEIEPFPGSDGPAPAKGWPNVMRAIFPGNRLQRKQISLDRKHVVVAQFRIRRVWKDRKIVLSFGVHPPLERI